MLVPFKKEHLEVMIIRKHEAAIIHKVDWPAIEKASKAQTGILDGRLIACGGITPKGNGIGDVWLIPSIYCEKVKVAFARTIKNWLEKTRKEMFLVKLESYCLDDSLHTSWMRFLGFKEVGKKVINNMNFIHWSKEWE